MRIRNKCAVLAALLGAVAVAGTAQADVVALTFEGLKNEEQILDFYNGGTGSLGSSGTNYGVSFGGGALALIDADAGGSGNFANEPSPNTIAFFLSTDSLIMNYAAGFDTGFSFFYTSSRVGAVSVYDGIGATGNLLATLNLDVNWKDNGCTGDPSGGFCNWDSIGVLFGGTAKSVSFAGVANQVGFDQITFGTDNPTPVPIPAALPIALAAFGGFGFAGWRQRKSA